MLKPLPIGTAVFRDIIEGGFLYVDKTPYIYDLIRRPKGVYFLSRPRRFGKSLLLSTLEEIFKGSQDLFQGLWLYDQPYSWEKYPIIYLDFSLERVQSVAALEEAMRSYLDDLAADYGLTLAEESPQRQFRHLIRHLAKENKVVVLIDEYDKPILDNLENTAVAKEIRDVLKSFYGVLKAMDRHLRFVFLTGISKFSRVGIFSDLNHLNDLTIKPFFATALGLTEEEIQTHFAEYIKILAKQEDISPDATYKKMRAWYDGFCFVGGMPHVYNSFSTLTLFDHQRFANYWFETGSPSFLLNLITTQNYDIRPLEKFETPALAFSTYDVENLDILPLLFQTGYLTIKDYQQDANGEIYTLSYPNYEVKNAFLTYILQAYSEVNLAVVGVQLRNLLKAVREQNFSHFFDSLNIFFANIPYDIQIKKEAYYQTIFHTIFVLLGLHIMAEVRTNAGHIDAVVELAENILLFEFKLDSKAKTALKQIKDKKYYQKYRLNNKSITLIGVNFDSNKRKVTEWETEEIAN